MPPERAREPTRTLLRRLRWTVIRPLARRLNGDERSTLLGPGIELASVREYRPGDDVRRIDWNLTARTATPYLREALVEGVVDVWLVIDVSPSVDWGTAECLKRYRAIELAAVVAELLGRHGNRLGLLLFADRPVAFVPPGAGRVHVERVIDAVRQQPRSAARGATDLAGALETIGRLARRPALIVVASDFLVRDAWEQPLRRLVLRHEVVAACLRDPREANLPDVGVVALEDPETGEQLVVDTGNRRLRERFARAAAAQADRLAATLRACGVPLLILETDRPILPVLAGFLEAQRRRRAQRGGTAGRAPIRQAAHVTG